MSTNLHGDLYHARVSKKKWMVNLKVEGKSHGEWFKKDFKWIVFYLMKYNFFFCGFHNMMMKHFKNKSVFKHLTFSQWNCLKHLFQKEQDTIHCFKYWSHSHLQSFSIRNMILTHLWLVQSQALEDPGRNNRNEMQKS